MPKREQKQAGQFVYEDLLAKILSRELPAGSQLSSERDLVLKYEVNRGAVREALRRLGQAGIVSTVRGGGTKVLEFERHAGLELINDIIRYQTKTFNKNAVRSLMEMRIAMGIDVVRLATTRRNEAAVSRLHEQLASLEESINSPKELLPKVMAFWDIVIQASENIAYQLAFNTMRETYYRFGELGVFVIHKRFNISEYRDVINAIEEKDPEKAADLVKTVLVNDSDEINSLIQAPALQHIQA
jgi:DNA-binding FadR family transcriptional regulator